MEKPFGAWRGNLVEQRRDNTFSYLHPCTRKPGHCSPHAWHGWPRSGSSNSGSWYETERQEINHQNCNSIHVTIPNVPSMAPPYSSYLTATFHLPAWSVYIYQQESSTRPVWPRPTFQYLPNQGPSIDALRPQPFQLSLSTDGGCINRINLKVPPGSQSHCSPIPT